MAQLWVPPTAARELVEGRKEYEAGVLSFLHLTGGILDDWNRELMKIDPFLRLGQAYEEIPAGYPLIPGYYHLVRLNPTAAPTTTPFTVDGEFAVPTSAMLDKLKESDMQNARSVAARKLAEEKEKREDEQRKQQERDDRRTELFERLDAAREVHISYDTDHRWTQNVNGRRGKHGPRDS